MKSIIIFAVIGAVIGVAVVRMFFLNSLEIVGWNLFWEYFTHFRIDMFRLIFKSATFGKFVTGSLIGACAGAVAGHYVRKR